MREDELDEMIREALGNVDTEDLDLAILREAWEQRRQR